MLGAEGATGGWGTNETAARFAGLHVDRLSWQLTPFLAC
jgi:hypothetical protein